ncbi:MAG TPA: RNA-binding protein [Methylomirabilota bacterium]|jgi:RNA recognition motif-containing protein
MAQKLFVGGLPFATSNDQLRDLFAEIGEVASATVVTDRDTGRSRGFGFVEMATVEAAEEAINRLNGRDYEGRRLQVEKAKASPAGGRPARAAGGGGGFGRGGGSRW